MVLSLRQTPCCRYSRAFSCLSVGASSMRRWRFNHSSRPWILGYSAVKEAMPSGARVMGESVVLRSAAFAPGDRAFAKCPAALRTNRSDPVSLLGGAQYYVTHARPMLDRLEIRFEQSGRAPRNRSPSQGTAPKRLSDIRRH